MELVYSSEQYSTQMGTVYKYIKGENVTWFFNGEGICVRSGIVYKP